MAGTGGSLIVRDKASIDGYLLDLPQGGVVSQTFVNPLSGVAIHNVTPDYIVVTINTIPAAPGNGIHYLSPGSAESFGNYPDAVIVSVDINDGVVLGGGGGKVICNGIFS